MEVHCIRCGSEAVIERLERTGTLLNRAQYPSDVIALVVLWRLRYKLSLRDLPEMFAVRGIVFSHEAVRDWKPSSRPHWQKVCVVAGAARQAAAGMLMRPRYCRRIRPLYRNASDHRCNGFVSRRMDQVVEPFTP